MKNSRRDFLKLGTCTVGYIAATSPGTLGAIGAKVLKGSQEFTGSYCEMCSSRCPIEVKVIDGKKIFIQGQHRYSNKTSVCARGGSGHSQLYDPQRLVKPLIRVGKRGENQWREASWDEALDLCARKLGEIRDQYGANSTIFTAKTGDHHHNMATFASAYGSPNVFSHESACPITYAMALPHTFGGKPNRDYANAKYILNFGHNLFEGIDIAMTKPLAKSASDDSVKFVVLEPRFSILAAKADEWLPIKPGTDVAVILSLLHVWLRDNKYDKEFVDKYCVGLDKIKEQVRNITPEFQEKITGIKASTVERIADEIYRAAPRVIIDWGHKTTTCKDEFSRTRAILIANALMGNLEKKGGIYFNKNGSFINKITELDIVPTLSNPDSKMKIPVAQRIDRVGEPGPTYFGYRGSGVLTEITPAIETEQPYPVKGWVSIRFNHTGSVASVDRSIKAYEKLDFIVAIDVYLNDFANYADVVLPESTYLERDEGISDKSGLYPQYVIRNKVVEPIGDTKSSYEIFRELARRMNIDKDYTWSDIRDYRMQQAKGNDKLLETLIRDGYAGFDIPPLYTMEKEYVKKFTEKYPTAIKYVDDNGLMSGLLEGFLKTKSGKIELFSQQIEDMLPGFGGVWLKDYDVFQGHKFAMINGKTPIHTNTHTQNIPFLNDLMSDSPIWLNAKVGIEMGLEDGDEIYLQNKFGKEKGKVMLTEGIRPDTVFVYHGFGHKSSAMKRTYGIGVNDSALLGNDYGHVCNTMITNWGVDIVKA